MTFIRRADDLNPCFGQPSGHLSVYWVDMQYNALVIFIRLPVKVVW
jgi:hypothetical protein